MNNLIATFEKWWKQPFSSSGDAVNWFLFVGFILVLAFFWTRVLKHVTQ